MITVVVTDNASNQNVETITVNFILSPTESISIRSATAVLNSTVTVPFHLFYKIWNSVTVDLIHIFRIQL